MSSIFMTKCSRSVEWTVKVMVKTSVKSQPLGKGEGERGFMIVEEKQGRASTHEGEGYVRLHSAAAISATEGW
jgi:hypothetical protein